MDSLGCLNSPLSSFYFYFVTNLQKKNYGVHTRAAEPPPHPIQASGLLAGPPIFPSEHTYFMGDPICERSESKNMESGDFKNKSIL